MSIISQKRERKQINKRYWSHLPFLLTLERPLKATAEAPPWVWVLFCFNAHHENDSLPWF